MLKHLFLLIVFIVIIPVVGIYAQEEYEKEITSPINSGNFWFGFGGETAMYSQDGYAYGGSVFFGYGSGSSIGLKAAFFLSDEGIDTLELNFLLRFYILKAANKGPFFQLMGGPSLFNRSGNFFVPSNSGTLNAGLGFGWRLIFNDWLFIEPSVRGGFPYLFGAAIAVGVCL